MSDKSDNKKFCCILCNYFCLRNAHLQKHLLSNKHVMSSQKKTEDPNCKFQCKKCNKLYKGLSGLWQHNKKCVLIDQIEIPVTNESSNIETLISDLKKHTEQINASNNAVLVNELNKLNKRIETLSNDINSLTTIPLNVSNINTTNNNNFNINVFLNETCKEAINLDSFIKNLTFEIVDPKLMIGNYVDGTCSILQKNLNVLPLNKRPLHFLEGEDPNQHLMHIRQDNKWNIGTYVNWLEQIHADDDDDVVDKNPIYYALKMIDDEKLKYLGYNHHQDADYKLQHGRLNREISRQDLKKIVYTKLLKMITLDQNVI